jgi:predicted transcriptional regulator
MSSRPSGIVQDLRRAIAKAEKRGVTQYRIAKLAGMPQSMVARIAGGKAVPKLDTAERVAKAIGCTLAIHSVVARTIVRP